MGKKNNPSSKRKATVTDLKLATEVSVLSHHSLEGKNGVDLTDDLSEPTMGEKLASLNLEEKDEVINHDNADSHAKPPSVDSVYILLKQALRADDRALPINCLYRQDHKVITNSLSLLNPSEVLKFLQSLVITAQLRGAVLACALPWLRSLLLQHSSSIMSQESSFAALNSLYQLIESRVSTFNQARELWSDLLYAESVDDGEEENNMVAPVIYESDDEGSEYSMEVESVEDGEAPQAYSDISDDEENNGEISD